MKKRSVVVTTSPSFYLKLEPKTVKQRLLIDAIETADMVIAAGSAGTGKTYIGVNSALNLLSKGTVNRIVVTRANIPTGRSLGFFPGTIEQKLEPWLAPMLSEMRKRLGTVSYEAKRAEKVIQIYPLETIRGASFDRTVVLIDEAQNLTYEEIKALSTRLGEGSKMVFMGDPQQRDTKESGLVEFQKVISRFGLPIPVIVFTADDIVRSDLVGKLVKAFMKYEGTP